MAFSNLFRKKTVQDILKQVAKNEADGHAALGRHLTAKDLTAFVLLRLWVLVFLVQSGKPVPMEVPRLSSYFYLLP